MKPSNLNVRHTLLLLGLGLGLAGCLLGNKPADSHAMAPTVERTAMLAHHVAFIASPWRANKAEASLLP